MSAATSRDGRACSDVLLPMPCSMISNHDGELLHQASATVAGGAEKYDLPPRAMSSRRCAQRGPGPASASSPGLLAVWRGSRTGSCGLPDGTSLAGHWLRYDPWARTVNAWGGVYASGGRRDMLCAEPTCPRQPCPPAKRWYCGSAPLHLECCLSDAVIQAPLPTRIRSWCTLSVRDCMAQPVHRALCHKLRLVCWNSVLRSWAMSFRTVRG
jgi:hypothetical protein